MAGCEILLARSEAFQRSNYISRVVRKTKEQGKANKRTGVGGPFLLQEFDMMKEKREYCDSDVTIVREGGMKFRDDFMKKNSVDPFMCSSTIAGACNVVFRTHHMKPHTIALIPPGGYKRRERHSIIAMK